MRVYFWQSGRPTASGGRFCAVVAEPEVEPAPLESDDIVPLEPVPLLALPFFAVDPLPEVAVLLGMLLPVLAVLPVCALLSRTLLAAASQHF